VLFEPVAPDSAERLWDQLGESGSVHEATVGDALEAPPETFGEPEELFEKIDDERVEELNERLEERTAEAEAAVETESDADAGDEVPEGEDVESEADSGAGPDLEPLADERIDFETFQLMDLRVGEILDAEPVDGADELLRLEVDIGAETRQIVAGLRQLHDVDALPGTRVVVVANLERAELFGVESNGMVLAAGDEADLLTTHGDVPPGTKVR
jgi:methionyl-tRNA synthetase